MSESTWWREELWWEKGLFQLGGSSVSARQLGTLAVICVFAFLASLPVGFSFDGISFAGRLAVFGLIALIGYFGLVQRRVKAVPLELQLAFWVTGGRARATAKQAKTSTRSATEPAVETHQILVADFKDPTPFSFTGTVRVGSSPSQSKQELEMTHQDFQQRSISVRMQVLFQKPTTVAITNQSTVE